MNQKKTRLKRGLFLVLMSMTVDCSTNLLHAQSTSTSTSLCEIVRGGKEWVGKKVRVRARYYTDFFHGARLEDTACAGLSLEIAADPPNNADPGVRRFSQALSKKYYDSHFLFINVDISGTLSWKESAVLNSALSKEKRLTMPAHFIMSLDKVWAFSDSN